MVRVCLGVEQMKTAVAVVALFSMLLACGPQSSEETPSADGGEWTTQVPGGSLNCSGSPSGDVECGATALPGFGLKCDYVDGGTVCTAP